MVGFGVFYMHSKKQQDPCRGNTNRRANGERNLYRCDAEDVRKLLFNIIYVCKSIVFYVLGPNSLLGY